MDGHVRDGVGGHRAGVGDGVGGHRAGVGDGVGSLPVSWRRARLRVPPRAEGAARGAAREQRRRPASPARSFVACVQWRGPRPFDQGGGGRRRPAGVAAEQRLLEQGALHQSRNGREISRRRRRAAAQSRARGAIPWPALFSGSCAVGRRRPRPRSWRRLLRGRRKGRPSTADGVKRPVQRSADKLSRSRRRALPPPLCTRGIMPHLVPYGAAGAGTVSAVWAVRLDCERRAGWRTARLGPE